jgi:hypothetical protein
MRITFRHLVTIIVLTVILVAVGRYIQFPP